MLLKKTLMPILKKVNNTSLEARLLVHCARAHSLSKQYSLFHMIIAFMDKEVQLFERYKEYLKNIGN